ncbi:hypothetical protein V6N11_005299 [Hibiscus sabdariffa]|uniref:Uncharacterized protein n=1 Tax=Hibiscus sabdariffa TaxID=183260 RepID=A0ABR2RME7_9ROSI
MVKGKVDKGSEVCLFFQNGMLLFWPSAFSSSCFQALLVLIGEATAGEKKWFNPECFCQVFESGVILSFPSIIAAVFLVTHNISWLLFNPLENVYGQATLTWFVWTNGELTECSSYHLFEVDFGIIIFLRLLQGVFTYCARQKLQSLNLFLPLFPCTLLGFKGNKINVEPSFDLGKMLFTPLKISDLAIVIPPLWSFRMLTLCNCAGGAATILVYDVYQRSVKAGDPPIFLPLFQLSPYHSCIIRPSLKPPYLFGCFWICALFASVLRLLIKDCFS